MSMGKIYRQINVVRMLRYISPGVYLSYNKFYAILRVQNSQYLISCYICLDVHFREGTVCQSV